MKKLRFESASEAIDHLKKLGGTRVQWTRIATNRDGSRRVTSERFVTQRTRHGRFCTHTAGNVRT